MNLESRAVVFEDVARQVLATGHRKPPEHFMNAIGKIKYFTFKNNYQKQFLEILEAITEDDIRRVAKKLLSTQPSVAARGEITKIPTYENIQSALLDVEGRLPGSKGRLLSFR